MTDEHKHLRDEIRRLEALVLGRWESTRQLVSVALLASELLFLARQRCDCFSRTVSCPTCLRFKEGALQLCAAAAKTEES